MVTLGAAATLGATERLTVAVGVMPAPLRNVALAAMEVATFERMFPGGYPPERMRAAHEAALATRRAAGNDRPLTLLIFLPVTVGPGAERNPGRGMVSGSAAVVADGLGS